MKFKKFMIVGILLLIIISINAVSASENITSDNLAVEDNTNELSIDSSLNNQKSADDCEVIGSSDVNDSQNIGSASDNDNLSAGSLTPKYDIDVQLTEVSSGRYDAQWGQSIIVNGTYENATGSVSISFADQIYNCSLEDGSFSYEIIPKYTKLGNSQKLIVNYAGDDTYKEISKTLYINVKLDEVVINDAYYGQSAFVTVNLYDATGNVTFTINGKTYRKELENGNVTQEFTNYTLGKNILSFEYEGDDNYNPITKDITFNTSLNIDAPTIYNYQTETVKVYLGTATGKVNFTSGNESYIVDIVNGVVSQEFNDYVIGDNEVLIIYSGDETFEGFNYTQVYTVLNKENATILSAVYQNEDKNIIAINIPYATGTINATINGKKEVLQLTDGQVIYDINSTDVITDITVDYGGNTRLNPKSSSVFKILDGVVDNDNYMYYFNQKNSGKLFDFISDGSTLEFQGSIINTNSSNVIYLDISKPVNVISTNGDAYIDLNTSAGSLLGENPGSRFAVSYGGSGSNISGIYLHNTQLWISNTSNVVIDNISVVVEDQKVGSGVGATSVRDNSSYVTIKNSYFYTRNNGGSTTFTFSWADHCIFDNNTVKAEGNVGNLLYLNVYNIENFPYYTNGTWGNVPSVPVNTNNKFTNNKIYGKEGSAISVGIMVEGTGNLIENNTCNKCSISKSFGGVNASNNSYIGNVLTEGSSLTAQTYSIIYNNIVPGTLSTGANSVAYNNTVSKLTVAANSEAYDNTAGGLTLNGANTLVHDNTVDGETTISAAGVQVYNNTFNGDNTIKFSNANAKNVVFANNTVVGNIEFANANAKNNTIVNNTITTAKDYAINLKTYTNTENNISNNILSCAEGFGNDAVAHADDETLILDNYQDEEVDLTVVCDNITVGQSAVFNITSNIASLTGVNIIVDGKSYSVSLTDGKGSVEVSDLLSGDYEVSAVSTDETYGGKNTTNLTVTKNNSPEIVVVVPEIIQWVDSAINVTIENASGNVTLTVNGTDIEGELVNGVVSLIIPNLTVGNYNFTVTYSGDDKYYGNSTNGNLTVNKNKEIKIIAYNITEEKLLDIFTVKFTNYIGDVIANANATIIIGDDTYNVTADENGEVTLDNLGLTRGKYNVVVSFNAVEDEYDAKTANYTIIVTDDSIIKIVSISGDCIITGSLCDILENPIVNASVTAEMNDVEYNLTTDENGLFYFQAMNDYEVLFIFDGNETISSSSTSITLSNVAHVAENSVISLSNVSRVAVDTAAGEKGTLYYFTLKDAQGNVLVNKTVKVILNGKLFTLTTDSNGKASFVISLNAAANYELNVFFMGNDDYKGSTASATIKISKKKTSIKIAKKKYKFKAKRKTKVIKATLKGSNKYLKAGKKVTVKIKGITYTAKTGKKGAIKLKIKKLTKKGTYKVKIKFAGDSTYSASSSKKIKIVVK